MNAKQTIIVSKDKARNRAEAKTWLGNAFELEMAAYLKRAPQEPT